jgi:hypothetical protein
MVSPSPISSSPPVGYNYSCPADNNSTQTIVIGTQIFSYYILCNSSFAKKIAFSVTAANSEGNCIALCSAADNLAQGPLCKGFSFDGVSCGLYTQALMSDVTPTSGVDSAILSLVRGFNTTFSNRTADAFEASSIAASITQGTTLVTPPPSFFANSTSTSSCFSSTYTDSSDGLVHWTETCSWYESWYETFASSATTIYSSQTILVEQGSGSNGAGNASGSARVGGASGSPGAAVSSVTATSTAISGLVTGGAGNGGSSGPSVTTITTILQGSTITYVSTFASSGFENGSNATGGAGSVISTATARNGSAGGETGTGGVIIPSVSTVTTIIGWYTSTYVTTFATSGFTSGGAYTGGPVPASTGPWNFSTTFYMSGGSTIETAISGETSGAMSIGTGTEEVLPTSGNIIVTVENATTITITEGKATSGVASGGTGPGGVITPSVGSNRTATTIANSTDTKSGETSETSANGGVISPPSSTSLSVATETGNRSGQQSPPRTVPLGTVSSTVEYTFSGWNYSSPLQSGTDPVETTPLYETTPGLPSSGFPVPTSNSSWGGTTTELPRSRQQISSGSSGFPIPSANSSWLGETHPLPFSTASAGTPYPPPLNYTSSPGTTVSSTQTVSSGLPIPTSNISWLATTTERPRSGQQSPPASSSFPTLSANSTWLGEPFPASTGPSTYCATMTSRETVTQLIYTSTPGCVCAPTAYGGFPWGGYRAFVGGGGQPPSSPTASTPTTSATPSAPPLSLDQVRRPNTSATPQQVDTSCNNIGNQIFNGEFEISDSSSEPIGWGFATDSNDIILPIIFLAFEDRTQHTAGGSREGRIVSNDTAAVGRILQPLTLCPNSTYSLVAFTRQSRVLAECTATFFIGGENVGVVSPGQEWGSGMSNYRDYTADAPEADLEISVQCIGSGDANGRRVIDFDDLSLVVKM